MTNTITSITEARKFFASITEAEIEETSIDAKISSIENGEHTEPNIPKVILKGSEWKEILGIEPEDEILKYDPVATLTVGGDTIYGPFPGRWLKSLVDDELYELGWYVACHNLGLMAYELKFVGFMLSHIGGCVRRETRTTKREERKERYRAPKRVR